MSNAVDAVMTLTVGGLTGEVVSCGLGPPTEAEGVNISTLSGLVTHYAPGMKDVSSLSLTIDNLDIEGRQMATLAITGTTLKEGGAAGAAISESISGWVASAEPATIEVDGERRVLNEVEFHPYSAPDLPVGGED